MDTISNLDEYQSQAMELAFYPCIGSNFIYPTLGLVGEAGEVAEKIKKLIRDDHSEISKAKSDELREEIGDVLWYISALATEFNLSLSEIATSNITKLRKRKAAGTLRGSGDKR